MHSKRIGGRQGINIESTLKTAMQRAACIGGKEGPIDFEVATHERGVPAQE
jgi:hypothetical protein